MPEIFVGFKLRFWSFAIFIDTGENSLKNVEQQVGLPQQPSPPTNFAWSRTPICLSSILVLKIEARSLTNSLKSTLPSAVK